MYPKYDFQSASGELWARCLDDLFNCHRYVSQGRVNPPHYIPCYDFSLTLSGRVDYDSCGYKLHTDTPLLLLSMPYATFSKHAWEDTEYERYILYAKPELIERFAPQAVAMERLKDANLVWARPEGRTLKELTLLMEQFTVTTDNVRAALMLAVLLHILFDEVDAGRGAIARRPYPYVNNVLRELDDDMESLPTIDEVCRRVGVGRTKFQRDFKSVTGSSWHRYLTGIRMKNARELLTDGESIQDTAMACGYSTESHFIMSFRKYYGETPGELLGRGKTVKPGSGE